MEVSVKQVSSLEKIRKGGNLDCNEIHKIEVLAGERFSYQICVKFPWTMFVTASVESDLTENIQLYRVRDAFMDMPIGEGCPPEDDIAREPGFMPDILVPLKETNYKMTMDGSNCVIWVKADIPRDTAPGTYSIRVNFTFNWPGQEAVHSCCENMTVEVIPAIMPEQKLIYTRWMYLDCIASAHGVKIFSEQHWELIDKYIAAAADVGVNMMLVPVITPPLDTEIGTVRPCVQLADIEKNGDEYTFSFDRLRRFIGICKKHGIRYYEIAHMFSQWGAKFAPNIMVTENGKTDYLFGWHVSADSPEYASFLKQYVAAVTAELNAEGIAENTYFHISDEPGLETLETYKAAAEIIRPLIGNSKTFDALSNYEFYEKGLVECPVTGVASIHEFLEHDIPNQWVYYCCYPRGVYPNAFLAMPSYRVRILGFLLYKYNIKGFLHWGFNYYNSSRSVYTVNPYLTTSADGAFPSGDPFIVYPGKDCVYPSIRGEVTFEAVQDMDICFALESIIGREEVVKMIDDAAERDLRFDDYPGNKEFIENLRQKMIGRIKDAVASQN